MKFRVLNAALLRARRSALVVAVGLVLAPLAGVPAHAADPAVPAVVEGESDFAELGESTGVQRLRSSAALAAVATPPTPVFGPSIDGYASNDPQNECDPTEKPGPVAMRAMLNQTYGLNNTGNITRNCGVGGTSEHKEGRALDYMLNVNNSSERAIAEGVLDWLLATDRHGNKHANARRLGIMYLIWNRQIWSSSRADEGWRSYSGDNPHTDHIHFSFSWAGARKQTTWWTSGSAAGPVAPTVAYDQGDGTMRMYRWLSDGNSFNRTSDYDSGSFRLSAVGDRMASGDVDGDGRDDIVMAYQQPEGHFSYYVWRNGNSAASVWYNSGSFSLANVAGRLVLDDFNGDGKAEPAVAYDQGDGTMRIYRWLSDGNSFNRTADYDSGSFRLSAVGDRMASGDVDGDGKADIVMAYQQPEGHFSYYVWRNGNSAASVWYNSGPFGLSNVAGRLVLGNW